LKISSGQGCNLDSLAGPLERVLFDKRLWYPQHAIAPFMAGFSTSQVNYAGKLGEPTNNGVVGTREHSWQHP